MSNRAVPQLNASTLLMRSVPRPAVPERSPPVPSASAGSRQRNQKSRPNSTLTTPKPANVARQPNNAANGAPTRAVTTPPPGTPVCLIPMAVARWRRNHINTPLVEAGLRKL